MACAGSVVRNGPEPLDDRAGCRMWAQPLGAAGLRRRAVAAAFATDAGPATSSTIPTTAVRSGPCFAPTICRAEVPSSRISTSSPAPAPTVSTAIM